MSGFKGNSSIALISPHDTQAEVFDCVECGVGLGFYAHVNNREQLQMHSHAEKGMWTLEAFHLNDLIVDAAWHHHEWYNGSGYPDGLKKRDIFITTRIITLADALDAMSASRPYREPYGFPEIMRQLEDGAEKQFDPQLVKITQKLLNDEKMEIIG